MPRDDLNELIAFLAVARERSFTRAATQLGLSPSSLSRKVSSLETRMGVRLLARTTRSVTATEAGQRLRDSVSPQLEAIAGELESIGEFRQKPAGTVRITAIDTVADTFIWPRLAPLLREFPDIRVEIDTSYRLVDIVAERYDFGVRTGEAIAKDMIAVRLSPDFRRMVVGSPAYFENNPVPATPNDLLQHNCITLRLSTKGGLFSWPLIKDGHEQTVRVSGQFTFNGTYQVLNAALAGCGLALSPEYIVRPHIEAGRLRCVLEDWQPTVPGFHLYYPSRRQMSRAMQLVLAALRLPHTRAG